MKLLFTTSLIFAFAFTSNAQFPKQDNRNLEEAVENNAEVNNESGQTELPEELVLLAQNPVDINTGDIDLLARYNLISKSQLNSLIDYKIKYGNMVELQELQLVPGFDKSTILSIVGFITVGKRTNIPETHQVTIRLQKSFPVISNDYSGPSYKMLFKYKGVFLHSLHLSFTGEKDNGELLFNPATKAFDFNSINIYYSGKNLIRKIIVGDFNVEFAQGLTLWQGNNFGGGNSILRIFKSARGILPYTGTDENRFFRGAGITFGKNNLTVDMWLSSHRVDANMETSLSGEKTITSLNTSGYHRTESEKKYFHQQKELDYGFAFTYKNGYFTSGICLNYMKYDLPIARNKTPYSNFKFAGVENYNCGINYTWSKNNFFLFGEAAVCKSNEIACLNGLLINLDSRLSLAIMLRRYSFKYVNQKSNAFGVNTDNTNESGKYIGVNYKFYQTLSASSSVDCYSFPFIKYRTDQPSYGYDLINQLDYIPAKKFAAYLRYRRQLRQINVSSSEWFNQLSNNFSNSMRVSVRFKIDNAWEYGARAEINFISGVSQRGTLLSQDIFYHPMGSSFTFNFRYAVFNCPSFDNRIYAYENDLPGSFSVPFFYGNGGRFYANVNLKIFRSLNLSLRYSADLGDNSQASGSEIKMQLKAILR